MKSTMRTYSFRAECLQDVLGSFEILRASDAPFKMVRIEADQLFPDCEAEFRSALGTAQIIELLQGDNDLHVVRETLRRCLIEENTMERNDDID